MNGYPAAGPVSVIGLEQLLIDAIIVRQKNVHFLERRTGFQEIGGRLKSRQFRGILPPNAKR